MHNPYSRPLAIPDELTREGRFKPGTKSPIALTLTDAELAALSSRGRKHQQGEDRMTKGELAKVVEKLVEDVAVANGAVIEDKEIKVGGKMTKSRVATGGFFDLDGARNVLARNLNTHKDLLTRVELPTQKKAEPAPAPEPTPAPAASAPTAPAPTATKPDGKAPQKAVAGKVG
jgi:hypothetical protein